MASTLLWHSTNIPAWYENWLNWRGGFVEIYHAIMLLPKNCLVFWKRQPWVSASEKLFSFLEKTTMGFSQQKRFSFLEKTTLNSLADVKLLVRVHKCLATFGLKEWKTVTWENQIVETKCKACFSQCMDSLDKHMKFCGSNILKIPSLFIN